LLPFPNQRVRNDNIRFFVRNNVKGIFEQDTYNTPHSELAALGGYITAKFLWNPDYDEDTAIHEFLEAYYGKAAGPIRTYIDMIHDYVEKENIDINIWVTPSGPHLTEDLLVRADGLWQQAEELAGNDPDVLSRVRISRMSPDYAIVERAARERASGKAPPDSRLPGLAAARFGPFMTTLASSGVTRLCEWKTLDLPEYRKKLAEVLGLPEDATK
jgi:hypothetical protein